MLGDVYKRQIANRPVAFVVLGAFGKYTHMADANRLKPVSYTHLDVYKRQVPGKAREPCRVGRAAIRFSPCQLPLVG